MRELTAYQCADGTLHTDERKALAHDEDLLGQELDGLLKLFAFGGKLTRNDEYVALIGLMGKRDELRKSIYSIIRILDHSQEE